MRLTDKKSWAISWIGAGLIILFNFPGWFLVNVMAPPGERAAFAQKIASIGDRTPMIAGGVMLTIGSLLLWREWGRPN